MAHARRRTMVVLAGAALFAAGCGGSATDRAGGAKAAEPRVLTMAHPNAGVPGTTLANWADEVSRRSGGTLEIEFARGWRLGESAYEAATIEDVRSGQTDMAWVGARAFDQVSVNSFQALVAPMLVDSYDLQAAVFEAGIPEQMLEGLDAIELVGVGVLPGPMRKVLGVSKPFVRATDFAGAIVGLQASAVADQTMLALGATPRAVPSSASLDGLDAYEQQLGSIVGNHYSATARYVTGNLNLWPRPLVIFMGRDTFESLSPEQQDAFRDASAAVISDALGDARAEDDSAILELCREGMTIAVASDRDIDDMRAAFEIVYDQLSSDDATKAYIDTIAQLKDELDATTLEVPACPPAPPADDPTADRFPDGTYQMTLTADDWRRGCGADPTVEMPPQGVRHELIFDHGSAQILVDVDGKMENGGVGTYDVFRDRIEFTDAVGSVSVRWSFDGESLTLTDVVNPAGCDDIVVLTSHPWVLVADADP